MIQYRIIYMYSCGICSYRMVESPARRRVDWAARKSRLERKKKRNTEQGTYKYAALASASLIGLIAVTATVARCVPDLYFSHTYVSHRGPSVGGRRYLTTISHL